MPPDERPPRIIFHLLGDVRLMIPILCCSPLGEHVKCLKALSMCMVERIDNMWWEE